jgi:hypothetical protein
MPKVVVSMDQVISPLDPVKGPRKSVLANKYRA